MLRFLITVSLLLTGIFTGIGLLLSRQWGWSEYASPELYVIYTNSTRTPRDYFIVKVDDTPNEGEPLTWNEGGITSVDCSPDGRTFSFLSTTNHVVTITQNGTSDERIKDPAYTEISVANNGLVALFDPKAATLRSGTTTIHLPGSTGVDISSQGLVLSTQGFAGLSVFSPVTGQQLLFLPKAAAGTWLASEDKFVYLYSLNAAYSLNLRPGTYMMDIDRVDSAFLNQNFESLLSPDVTKGVGGVIVSGGQSEEQIVTFSALTTIADHVVTNKLDVFHWPICFLTFRPQMLIADTQ